MTWEYDGFRIFWDDTGDVVDTICEMCYFDISLDELYTASATYKTGDMEVDSPLHCDWCERPLVHNLTGDGIGYVLDAMRRKIYNQDGSRRRLRLEDYKRRNHGPRLGKDRQQWFDGSPEYEVLAHWNELLQFYQLSDEDYDLAIEFANRIAELESSLRYKFYWKKEALQARVVRPLTMAMRRRYRRVLSDIEEFQG